MELRNYGYSEPNETSDAVEKVVKELKNLKKEKVTNIHKNHRMRLKHQYLTNGFESLTDIQKLEVLLFYSIPQKDTNPIAHELISAFGSLKNVLKADHNELMKIKGIKENTATLLTLVNSMLNFCNQPDLEDSIGSSSEAKSYVSKFYYNVDVEQFYVFCLNKSNKIKKHVLIQSGTADEVNVQIRHITQIARESKCNRIIVSHNHPNGKAQMSDEDCAFTYSLICSCLLNSIDLLDHIIVGTDKAISLSEQQITDRLKARAFKTIRLPDDKFKLLSASSEAYIISPEN